MSEIMYTSTRDANVHVTASQAILQGLSKEGGLFVPESIPPLPCTMKEFAGMDYRRTAFHIMKAFLTDFTDEELRACIDGAYADQFDVPEKVPVVKAADSYYIELWHGPTIAFKDMALQILPRLMTAAAAKQKLDREIVILTATSGDTGKAALAGFADVPGTKIIVFFPEDGVSPVQKRQMVTQKGENTFVVGVRGNFDDCQTCVKQMFTDPEMTAALERKGYMFSSANSINVGRLVPQVVYYVYACARLIAGGVLKDGEKADVTVPTGNFGNILAAYMAKRMGAPIDRLICASNENRVLTDFFDSGIYDRERRFILTSSPSMDILISSNLERMIYWISGNDAERCKALMKSLSEEGRYDITDAMKSGLSDFAAGSASEEEVFSEIRRVFESDHYLLDPHTAVASAVTAAYTASRGGSKPVLIASTASPYKFTRSVMNALGEAGDETDDFRLADSLSSLSGTPVPSAIKDIEHAPVLHTTVTDPEGMPSAVKNFLNV